MNSENALDHRHWIWTKFDELNGRHFGGLLEAPQQILRSNFKRFAALSVNKVVDGVACRMIWLDGAALDSGPSEASDSLLHEMVHYELASMADGDGDAAHGARFVRRADEIGRALGLAPCAFPGLAPEQVKQVATVWPKVQRDLAKIPRRWRPSSVLG